MGRTENITMRHGRREVKPDPAYIAETSGVRARKSDTINYQPNHLL
jgi:hypothetical protein